MSTFLLSHIFYIFSESTIKKLVVTNVNSSFGTKNETGTSSAANKLQWDTVTPQHLKQNKSTPLKTSCKLKCVQIEDYVIIFYLIHFSQTFQKPINRGNTTSASQRPIFNNADEVLGTRI